MYRKFSVWKSYKSVRHNYLIVSKVSYLNLLHVSVRRPSSGAVNIKYIKEDMIIYGEACVLHKWMEYTLLASSVLPSVKLASQNTKKLI